VAWAFSVIEHLVYWLSGGCLGGEAVGYWLLVIGYWLS